jgi:hypothetical protein
VERRRSAKPLPRVRFAPASGPAMLLRKSGTLVTCVVAGSTPAVGSNSGRFRRKDGDRFRKPRGREERSAFDSSAVRQSSPRNARSRRAARPQAPSCGVTCASAGRDGPRSRSSPCHCHGVDPRGSHVPGSSSRKDSRFWPSRCSFESDSRSVFDRHHHARSARAAGYPTLDRGCPGSSPGARTTLS